MACATHDLACVLAVLQTRRQRQMQDNRQEEVLQQSFSRRTGNSLYRNV